MDLIRLTNPVFSGVIALFYMLFSIESMGQEALVIEEPMETSLSSEQMVLIQPGRQMSITLETYVKYTSSEMLSFRSGVSIAPKRSGWFRASIEEIGDQEPRPLFSSENDRSKFTVFPNPVSKGYLTIRWAGSPAGDWSAELFDLQGRQVVKSKFQFGTELELDIRLLPEGAYVLWLTQGQRAYARKILVDR